MATYGWRKNLAVAHGLFDEAYSFDFYQAVKLLEILYPDRVPVGEDVDPEREVARFKSRVRFDFPPSDIDYIRQERSGEPVEMLVNFMGLAGGLSPLPREVAEQVYRRSAKNDNAFRDFLDVFNHRLVSILYRARKRSRVSLQTRSPEHGRYARCLFALMGLGTPATRERMAVADRSLLGFGGLLARSARAMGGLVGMLEDYFGVKVRAESFQGRWLDLALDQHTRIGVSGQNQVLGENVVVGTRVWDQQAGVELRMGSLGIKQFLDLLPTGQAFRSLCSLTRFYAGDTMDFTLRLTLKASEVPELRLGHAGDARLGWSSRLRPERLTAGSGLRLGSAGGARLGWTTWLKTREFTKDDSQVCLRVTRR